MTAGRRPFGIEPGRAPSRRDRRVWSLVPAAAGAIAYVVLYLVLQPLLNESSDVSFFLSLGLLTSVLGFTVFALARAIWGKRRPSRPTRLSEAGGTEGSDDEDGDPPAPTDSNVVH